MGEHEKEHSESVEGRCRAQAPHCYSCGKTYLMVPAFPKIGGLCVPKSYCRSVLSTTFFSVLVLFMNRTGNGGEQEWKKKPSSDTSRRFGLLQDELGCMRCCATTHDYMSPQWSHFEAGQENLPFLLPPPLCITLPVQSLSQNSTSLASLCSLNESGYGHRTLWRSLQKCLCVCTCVVG